MRRALSCLCLVTTVLIATTADRARAEHTVQFKNNSDWTIEELYLSPTAENHWGPDQLGEDVIAKGDSLTLSGITSRKYDLRIVDEDGDECIVKGVSIKESESVAIGNADLVGCQAATAEDEESEE